MSGGAIARWGRGFRPAASVAVAVWTTVPAAVPGPALFSAPAAESGGPEAGVAVHLEVDWEAFLAPHDLIWNELPQGPAAAPYCGNGLIGSMLFADLATGRLRLEVSRSDLEDDRGGDQGPATISRPRLPLGYFLLQTEGAVTGAKLRLDLWRAEVRGTLKTAAGSFRIRHFVPAEYDAVVTALEPVEGSGTLGATSPVVPGWSWHPHPAAPAWAQVQPPRDEAGVEALAARFGQHHQRTLRPYRPHPDPVTVAVDGVPACVQDLAGGAGGHYATGWQEAGGVGGSRWLVAAVERSDKKLGLSADGSGKLPSRGAHRDAARSVAQLLAHQDRTGPEPPFLEQVRDEHQRWWRAYYPMSFLALPDARLEGLYWRQVYKLAAAGRPGLPMIDAAGPWVHGETPPVTAWDHRLVLTYAFVFGANRGAFGRPLAAALSTHRTVLVDNVRPRRWQVDSAFLPAATGRDLRGARTADMRAFNYLGGLPLALHTVHGFYRTAPDDELLEDLLYPLLKRAVSVYLHLLVEDEEGRLHLRPARPPARPLGGGAADPPVSDSAFDLALLRWGCTELLRATRHLGVNPTEEPHFGRWRDVVLRLADYPLDPGGGWAAGTARPAPPPPAAPAHLTRVYPLRLHAETRGREHDREALRETFLNWARDWKGLPAEVASTPGAGAARAWTAGVAAALDLGDEAAAHLGALAGALTPNGLYAGADRDLAAPLGAAGVIQDLLLQGRGGQVHVFPALPGGWDDVAFHDLRAEGGFLVSAARRDGRTRFVRLRNLARGHCVVVSDMPGPLQAEGERTFTLTPRPGGAVEIDLFKGEEVLLYPEGERPEDLGVRAVERP